MQASSHASRDLVLVGGGHAHVQVIRRFIMDPIPDVALTVVLDRTDAVYSGMVPGFVAGDYRASELTIDLVPLMQRAGGTVVVAAAERVDPVTRTIFLNDRPPLRYDVASIDVGSTVRGLDLPGVRENALSTRPIADFVNTLDEHVETFAKRAKSSPVRVVVVGAGAAGVELCCTLNARIRAQGRTCQLMLITQDSAILSGASARMRAAMRAEFERLDIGVVTKSRVLEVKPGSLITQDTANPTEAVVYEADLIVWATGAAAHSVCRDSNLPQDEAGFIEIGEDLLVKGYRDLFAAGDCAAFSRRPLPKAGVYAVRQGPLLDLNLRAVLSEGKLRAYQPQSDFLSLLNLGDRRALGGKWGFALSGEAVWRLKDFIDRRFMVRFQVLDEAGRPASDFPAPGQMGDADEEMLCGGCAAKVGAGPLERALSRLDPAPADPSVIFGLDAPDDAAAVRMSGGDILLATVDAFRAFTEDAYLVGRIAALNALSDVLAKGGRPRHALAIVTVPDGNDDRTEEMLFQVVSGIRRALDDHGVSLIGGHSTVGPELFVGLSITGDLPNAEEPLSIDRLRSSDVLILTKALGTGVLLAANAQGLAPGKVWQSAIAGMLRSNADACRVALDCDVAAATDVSGFGLLGHLGEMLEASGCGARIDPDRFPCLPLALDLLERDISSSLHEANRVAERFLDTGSREVDDARVQILFDPQTSGGLLIGVARSDVDRCLQALHAAGDSDACVVGHVVEGEPRVALGALDGL